jgi:PBP1b-binding outer membrane lipoprotein LpoB
MKQIKILSGMFLVVLLLAGCASMGGTVHEDGKVKCPACGYEFNMPSDA